MYINYIILLIKYMEISKNNVRENKKKLLKYLKKSIEQLKKIKMMEINSLEGGSDIKYKELKDKFIKLTNNCKDLNIF